MCLFKIKKVPELDDDVKYDRIKYCKDMLKRRAKPIEETFYGDEWESASMIEFHQRDGLGRGRM